MQHVKKKKKTHTNVRNNVIIRNQAETDVIV